MPGIIVGVDGSPHSRRALQWALSEAAARHAPLTVLSVREERAITCTASDLTQDQAAEEVQELVDLAVSSQSGPAPPVTVQVIPGSPAAELIDAGHDADLLVMGSRGSGGLGQLGGGLGEQPGGLRLSLPGGHHLLADSGRSGGHAGRRAGPVSWGS